MPALIADLGDHASWRYVEFLTANIRNLNTRRAYARATARFFAWGPDHEATIRFSGKAPRQRAHSSDGIKAMAHLVSPPPRIVINSLSRMPAWCMDWAVVLRRRVP